MQKIIICEGAIGEDLTLSQPLAGHIADGYEVEQVSAFSTRENRLLCSVLLSKSAEQPSENENDTEQQGDDTEQQDGE